MLNNEKKQNHKEIFQFWGELHNPINLRDFEKARKVVERYTAFFKENLKSEGYYFWLLRDLGWLREGLDATQRNNEKGFEPEAIKLVTAMNKLILIIISQIEKLPLEKQDFLFEIANRVFGPIFVHIDKEKQGFASFVNITLDRNYYKSTYSGMADRIETEEGIKLTKFKKWKDQLNKEFAKKMGVSKK